MLQGALEWVANGNVNPCRFVKIDTTVDGRVVEATAVADVCYGISQEGTRTVPYSGLADTKAAIAGEPIKVFKLGEVCLLEVSAAVTRGARLGASAGDGRGLTAAAGSPAFALALRSAGGAGEKIPVLVIFDTVNT
jgi:hypothetical protein